MGSVRYMVPSSSENNSVYDAEAESERFRDLRLRNAGRNHCSNFVNIGFASYRITVALSTMNSGFPSPLGYHILHILAYCSGKKVARSIASTYVAVMADIVIFWYRTLSALICQPMSKDRLCSVPENPISSRGGSLPYQTRIGIPLNTKIVVFNVGQLHVKYLHSCQFAGSYGEAFVFFGKRLYDLGCYPRRSIDYIENGSAAYAKQISKVVYGSPFGVKLSYHFGIGLREFCQWITFSEHSRCSALAPAIPTVVSVIPKEQMGRAKARRIIATVANVQSALYRSLDDMVGQSVGLPVDAVRPSSSVAPMTASGSSHAPLKAWVCIPRKAQVIVRNVCELAQNVFVTGNINTHGCPLLKGILPRPRFSDECGLNHYTGCFA